VKLVLVPIIAALMCSFFAGCASGKTKSGVRMYEGDSSPNIRMYDEKPGYPVNTL
jgi:hypothetical protein